MKAISITMKRLLPFNISLALALLASSCSTGIITVADQKKHAADDAKAIELNPNDAVAYYNRGRDRLGWDKDGAMADFNKAIELDPNNGTAYLNREFVEKGKGDEYEATADINKVVELAPNAPIYGYHKITIEEIPAYVDYFIKRGLYKQHNGDLDGAIYEFNMAIEVKPDEASAYGNRGNANGIKGDLDGSIADFTKVIQLQPDSAEAYYNRGTAKLFKGGLSNKGHIDSAIVDDAIADFTKAIQLKPDFAKAYGNRSNARLIKGDIDGSKADSTKANELKSVASPRGSALGL